METKQLTKKYLWSIFDLNNGKLIWKDGRRSVKAGTVVGYFHKRDGVIKCKVNGSEHPVHRLIMTMFHGDLFDNKNVLHINGDRTDNNILNLTINDWGSLKGECHDRSRRQ